VSRQHTPGPWHLCQHLKSIEDDQACRCGYRGVIYGPEHHTAMAICQPGHELPSDPEQHGTEPARYPLEVELANMRLIAAAPELLDALERLLADYGEAMPDGYVENSIHSNEVKLARAAIAKARGDA
jgi:hypothetical protein